MLKVLAIHGSPHNGQTYEATLEFLKELGNRIEIDAGQVFLFQERLELCRGCGTCIVLGEERCPNQDGLREIHAKMRDADAVIITTPVYALHVSALVKNFIERSAFMMHRPCFFGKWFMPITTQAFSGDKDVAKYMKNAMHFLGFHTIPGLHLTGAPGSRTTAQKNAVQKKINDAVDRFQAIQKQARFPVPAWKDFMMFRFRRSGVDSKDMAEVFPRDLEYFRENGWLKRDYYYDVRLNPLMKAAGRFFDASGRKMMKAAAGGQNGGHHDEH